MNGFFHFLMREYRLSLARLGDHLTQAAFFVMVATLFPLAVGPSPELLKSLGVSIIWIAALLSALPSFDRLFADDYRGGWLEQICLSPHALHAYVLAKIASWYLFALLPLLAITPLLMLFFNLPWMLALPLITSLALGLAALMLLGAIASALTLGARRTAMLVALLVLPLAIPIVVFGVMAAQSVLQAQSPSAHFSLLSALVLFLLVVSPVASVAGLRSALEDG
ncbi:MAG: heme exporter protein CcmB [Alphaproteobacteria bacterium]|jgi:heme exporter protein B|nr:heme exporter protein CcmB [Alphaproteobacteria bacterium]MBL6775877.1 heme exporter protein CcmB [Alphaproteobacteria bacterium]